MRQAPIILKMLRYRTRELTGISVPLFLTMHRLGFRWNGNVVGKDTDLVIEGFPRSGNTFAVAAYRVANKGRLRIASHVHLPAHVRLAVRWGIPTLCIVREPKDAVVSLCIREPWMELGFALRSYIRFHEQLLPSRSDCFWISFKTFIDDPRSAMTGLNRRFGTTFHPIGSSRQDYEECFRMIDKMDREDQESSMIGVTTVARPLDAREKLKEPLFAELKAPRYAELMDHANEIYNTFRGAYGDREYDEGGLVA